MMVHMSHSAQRLAKKMEMFNSGTSILIVAAHPDDESLGMGGTIPKLSKLGCKIRVLFLSDGVSSRDFERESLIARREASRKALSLLGVDDIHFYDFPDNQLDSTPILLLAKQI